MVRSTLRERNFKAPKEDKEKAMRRANRTAYSWILGTLVSIVLSFGRLAPAQTGYNIVQNGTGTSASASIVDASIFSGANICAQINAAWTWAQTPVSHSGAGLTSATIDARGITGLQNCSASPFPLNIVTTGNNANGTLLLGNVQITTSVTWQIPSRVHVVGIGVNPLSDDALTTPTYHNTVIKAGSGVTGAVVQLGNGSGLSFDAQIKSLTVDGDAIASIGILNDSSQEGSTVEDVDIFNVPGTGLLINSASSSVFPNNSGPYRNINIQYNSTTCPSCNSANTVGVGVIYTGAGNIGIIRGIDNVTVSGAGTIMGEPGTFGPCIQIRGYPVQVTNSHVEYCTTGIQIGSSGGGGGFPETYNVEIQNVSIFPNGTSNWNITIQDAADILLSGITAWSTDVLQDNVTGNTIIGTSGQPYFLGYYLLGDTTNTAVISTNSAIATGFVTPGNLDVLGSLTKHGGMFKIDHPLDPANKYLYHSFVESPDMMNVYNGSVTTDKHGMAVVTLPVYFDALNRDFRYQLTAIGSFAQATVAKEVENNRFAIRTSKPGVKVSWQVTGIRQDAYANAHPIQVEAEKPAREQGHYLHPELFESRGKQVAAEQAVGK
jgi:hypothetical protein